MRVKYSVYSCSVCEKTFTTKTNLNRHYRIHSEKKDFVCHICNRAFRRSDHLKAHVLRHGDNQDYVYSFPK